MRDNNKFSSNESYIDIQKIKDSLKLSDFIGKDVKLKKSGKDYTGLCPFHNEKNPSFTVYDGTGKYHCFSCRAQGDIFDYLKNAKSMKLMDALEYLGYGKGKKIQITSERKEEETEWVLAYPVPTDHPKFDKQFIFNINKKKYDPFLTEDVYGYQEADGSPAFYVVLKRRTDGNKWTPPVSLYKNQTKELRWCFGAIPSPRPLYNLPSIIKEKSKTILIVEGEKCAKLASMVLDKYVVTTWSGGAGNFNNTDWSPIQDRKVIIWPDNDKVGKDAAKGISKYLSNFEIMEIPEEKAEKWDVADCIEEGYTSEEIDSFIQSCLRESNQRIFPKELCYGYGYLRELVEFILSASNIPHPLLAMGSALSILSVLSAQKIMTEDRILPNLYIVTLAPSGSGKSFPFDLITEILNEVGASKLLMGAPISSSGLISALHRNKGRGLIPIDEFGRFFKEITDPKAAGYKMGIVTKLLTLFSNSRTQYRDEEYSSKDQGEKAREPIVINKPHISIYGTTVPSNFYTNITHDDSLNGFVGRLLVLDGIDINQSYQKNVRYIHHMPDNLKDYLKIMSIPPKDILNDSGGMYDYVVKEIPFSNDARLHMEKFRDDMANISKQCEDENPFKGSVFRRAYEMASKLALLGRDSNEEIGLHIVEWATQFVYESRNRLYLEARDNIFDSSFGKYTKQIELHLKKKRRWVSRKEIYNAFRIEPNKLTTYLHFLLEAEIIEEKKEQRKSQRETSHYRYRTSD